MHVISGADEHDATMLQKNISFDKSAVNTNAKIAYIKDTIYNDALEPQVREKTIALLEKLKADGHDVEAVAFDYMDYLIPAYYVLSTAEASSNLSTFYGVHYGYRSTNAQNMDQVYTKSRTEGFGKEVKHNHVLRLSY